MPRRQDYIQVRISQLETERDNPHCSEYDSTWYNRLIQELGWAEQMMKGEVTENCSLPFRHLETTLEDV